MACCLLYVVMLFQRTLTHPSPTSKPREPSNSLTGVQLVSRSVSTTSHQPSSQVVIWLRYNVPSACCPTPPPLLKHGLDLTTSSILCTPRELSFTGMLVKVWKKVNSPKPVKIWLLSKRITKKSVSTPSTVKTKVKAKNIKFINIISYPLVFHDTLKCLFKNFIL